LDDFQFPDEIGVEILDDSIGGEECDVGDALPGKGKVAGRDEDGVVVLLACNVGEFDEMPRYQVDGFLVAVVDEHGSIKL
jgi:hypothetical protein